jgi:hypothetical protein
LLDSTPLTSSTRMEPPALADRVAQRSMWYGESANKNRRMYLKLKGTQLLLAATIPVVSVAAASNAQRWTDAVLGSLIGIVEGWLQLGQYQQNWLLYRTTREALKREEFLYSAAAGPYRAVANKDEVYVDRCDAITSGESSRWMAIQQQPASENKG